MRIRVGIAGLGRIGKQQLACFGQMASVGVAAVADPDIRGKADIPADVKVCQRWEEILADPSIDAISVCTPHRLHATIALAALEAGKHVLVEKPLAITIEETRTVISAAQRRNRVLMVELTHRFYPPIREARAMVKAGRVGRVFAVEDRIIEPAGEQISSWLTQRAIAGGGVALTNGIHMLDRIAAVIGRALRFHSGCAGYGARLGDVEDTAAMLLTTDDGVPVQVLAGWPRGGEDASDDGRGGAPGEARGHRRARGSGACDDELTIYGDRGTLRVWAWRGWRFEPSSSSGDASESRECYAATDDIGARVRTGVAGALREFVSAIVEGREPSPAAADALAAQELVEQFYQHAIGGGGLAR